MFIIKFIFTKLLFPVFILIFTIVLTVNIIYLLPSNTNAQTINAKNQFGNVVKRGNIASMVTLGEMYEKDHFVKKNFVKSQIYFKKAINHINAEIDNDTKKITRLKDKMKIDSKPFPVSKVSAIQHRKTSKQLSSLLKKIKIIKTKLKTNVKNKPIVKKIVTSKLDTNDYLIYDELETVDESDLLIDGIDPIVIYNDDLINENSDTHEIDEYVKEEKNTIIVPDEKVSKNSFTSNQCNTAAARYIAKCLKLKRKRY